MSLSTHILDTALGRPAANVAITSGNNQTAIHGTQLPQALSVLVTDQYGNPISGDSVNFSDGGAGGAFSNANPVVTGANGTAAVLIGLVIASAVRRRLAERS